ncbi:uncharacterized protein B0T15DRAFT_567163 [Chaetomium strumarium]|uniref:Protein kinase domain-containing protein n=1 Tax=Chaetomium strumarium TaxID=1170767 RepID=A0AAJ0GS17_9PEZI|nr:hypothetical protein B0T15DRAFT_567163 [Chaetomium strumarium]
MEEEIARLRQALENERRLREEAESRASEEQRRREEAEKIVAPLQLEPYLEACHALNLAIKVVTDRSLTTQGDTTNPAGRVYPRRIVPWDDFPARQEDIWNRLLDLSFASRHTEHGLRYYEHDTVENAVKRLVDTVYENPVLRASVGLYGTVTFESHTSLGPIDGGLSEPSDSAPPSGTSTKEAALVPPAADCKRLHVAKGKGKGKGNRADQFCIYRTFDGANVPATAIEYKAPYKLSQDELVTGLVSEIQPERDVINKDGDDFAFAAKALATAVVTQLFSYMVGRGIQYGYVCIGQAFVFLHIPDDPAMVYYYNSLYPFRASPPLLAWYDAAAGLDTWAVEYDDMLSRIPPSVRKDKCRVSLYKPQRWQGFTRSPIRPVRIAPRSTPNADRLNRLGRKATTSGTGSGNRRGQRGRGGGRQGGAMQQRIQDQPYCTHKCLLGVLAKDRGPDADSTLMYLSGSVGSLFKLRLSAYGYTLVAKGVETGHLDRLSYEKDVYNQLQHIQGNYVPVCLGLIHLVLPYYYDGGVFEHFLLTTAIDLATKAYSELHQLQVLHVDVELRNLLYDRADPNGQGRKRKPDDFTEEFQSVVERVSLRFGDNVLSGLRQSGIAEFVVPIQAELTCAIESPAEKRRLAGFHASLVDATGTDVYMKHPAVGIRGRVGLGGRTGGYQAVYRGLQSALMTASTSMHSGTRSSASLCLARLGQVGRRPRNR